MKTWTVSILACALISGAFAGSWETAGYRTAKGKLIVTGMQMTEVKREAGEPFRRRSASGGKSYGKGKNEVWMYRGSDGVYSLTFVGNTLAKIEVSAER